jgi:hypothetical protein
LVVRPQHVSGSAGNRGCGNASRRSVAGFVAGGAFFRGRGSFRVSPALACPSSSRHERQTPVVGSDGNPRPPGLCLRSTRAGHRNPCSTSQDALEKRPLVNRMAWVYDPIGILSRRRDEDLKFVIPGRERILARASPESITPVPVMKRSVSATTSLNKRGHRAYGFRARSFSFAEFAPRNNKRGARVKSRSLRDKRKAFVRGMTSGGFARGVAPTDVRLRIGE